MNIVARIRLTLPPSIGSDVKFALYRLIGLNAWAVRRLDLYLSRRAYRRAHGREADLEHPVLFSEKMTARKLFDRRPIFSKLADKVLVRDFVADRIGSQFLPEMYLVCRHFKEIDFDKLPDKFVIKPNHGCNWISIVEDKKSFDREAACKLFRRWMKTDYYVTSREFFYKDIDRKILIEEYLQENSGAPAIDYRFFVYDGVPKFFFVSQRRAVNGVRTATFFNRAFQRLQVRVVVPASAGEAARRRQRSRQQDNSVEPYTPPANIGQLFDIAGKLGRGFDFMRVDLYNPGGRILFGEMTSMASGGVRPFDPPDFDRIFGEDWILSLSDAGSERITAAGAGDI